MVISEGADTPGGGWLRHRGVLIVMHTARSTVFAATLVVALALSAASPAAAVVDQAASPTIETTGQLVVLADSGEDLAAHTDEGLPAAISDESTFAVVTDSGAVIPIDGDFADTARTGDDFTGSLVVPDRIADDLDIADGVVVAEDTALGDQVVQRAATADEPLVVQSADVQQVAVAAAATPAAHYVDIAIVTVSGIAPTTTAAQADSLATKVGGFWVSQTGGTVASFTRTDAVRQYSSTLTCSGSNDSAFWSEAAAAFGRTSGSYYGSSKRHLVVILPSSCEATMGIGLGSIGTINGGGSIRIVEYADTITQSFAHEIGHNFGLGHSNVSYCGGAMLGSTSCAEFSYADAYSVMGYAWVGYPALPALPAPMRDSLGAFTSSGQVVISATSNPSGGAFALKPATDSAGVRSVRIDDPLSSFEYFVEYRTGAGDDSGAIYRKNFPTCQDSGCTTGWGAGPGVRILVRDLSDGSSRSISYTHYVDQAKPKWGSPAVGSGVTFRSPSGGVEVSVGQLDAATAAISVVVNQSAVTGPGSAAVSTHSWDPGLFASSTMSGAQVHAWGQRSSLGAWGTGTVNYQAGATTVNRGASSGSVSVRIDATYCASAACAYGAGSGYKSLVQLWNDPLNYVAFGLINDPGVSPRGTTLMIEGAANGRPIGGYWPASALSGTSHVFDIAWGPSGMLLTIDGTTTLGPYRVSATNPSISFLSAGRNTGDISDTTFSSIQFASGSITN
jgi:Metallo-peptidase family M12